MRELVKLVFGRVLYSSYFLAEGSLWRPCCCCSNTNGTLCLSQALSGALPLCKSCTLPCPTLLVLPSSRWESYQGKVSTLPKFKELASDWCRTWWQSESLTSLNSLHVSPPLVTQHTSVPSLNDLIPHHPHALVKSCTVSLSRILAGSCSWRVSAPCH